MSEREKYTDYVLEELVGILGNTKEEVIIKPIK